MKRPPGATEFYWCACNRCGELIATWNMSDLLRRFATHELEFHKGSTPHMPDAGIIEYRVRHPLEPA